MASRWRLDGKTALVTGGTKGIGRAIAEELLSLGARVFICARSPVDVAGAVEELRAKGWPASGRACDVADKAQREDLVRAVEEEFGGKLNHLINNVGTNTRLPTTEYSEEDFHRVFSTNLESAFFLAKLTHPLLQAASQEPSVDDRGPPSGDSSDAANQQVQRLEVSEKRRGDASIVFNSSVAGLVAIRSGSLYAMTKGAMNQLTRYLACEWAKDGIRVNAVAPWYISTELANQVLKDPDFKKDVISRTPMRRTGDPEEVAAAVAFFCLGAASFVTGQVVAVDGGFSVSGFFPLQD